MVEMECMEEGYLAKIVQGDGAKEIKVGEAICVTVEEEGDIEKFKDYKPSAADADAAPSDYKPSVEGVVAASSPCRDGSDELYRNRGRLSYCLGYRPAQICCQT